MSENGSGSEIVDVAYGEGWASGRGAVLGPISSEAAATRDAAGEPYAVVLRQADHPAVVVAHAAWAHHHLGLWVYDAQGRRFRPPWPRPPPSSEPSPANSSIRWATWTVGCAYRAASCLNSLRW